MAFITSGGGASPESIQDIVGAAFIDSASIDFTYNDAGNTITAAVIPGGVDHGSIAGLSDDDHTQYFKVTGRTNEDLTISDANINFLTDGVGSVGTTSLTGRPGSVYAKLNVYVGNFTTEGSVGLYGNYQASQHPALLLQRSGESLAAIAQKSGGNLDVEFASTVKFSLQSDGSLVAKKKASVGASSILLGTTGLVQAGDSNNMITEMGSSGGFAQITFRDSSGNGCPSFYLADTAPNEMFLYSTANGDCFKFDTRSGKGNLSFMAATGENNLLWNTDGSGDIGASGANRPDNLYVKTNGTFGGVVKVGAGSESVPSITDGADPDNGFYFPGSNTIGLTTAGSLKWTIGSLGSLVSSQGIGNSNGFIGWNTGSSNNYGKIFWSDGGVSGASQMKVELKSTALEPSFSVYKQSSEIFTVYCDTPQTYHTGFHQIAHNGDPGSQTNAISIGAKDVVSGSLRTLHLRTEQAVATDAALVSTDSLVVWINNVQYKIPLVAV